MSEQVLDQAVLDEIVRRIVAVAQPEKIILFGSAARGEMSFHSDVDLLVVKDGGNAWTEMGRIYEALYGVDAAVDAVVVTRAHSVGTLQGLPRVGDEAGTDGRKTSLWSSLSAYRPTILANG